MAVADWSGRFSLAVGGALLTLLLAKPAWTDVQTLVHPQRPEDIKLAIQYARTHEQPGDLWYIYHWARYQFWYYSDLYQRHPSPVRIGVDCGTDVACYTSDLDRLRGQPRVWVVFSHIWIGDGLQEENLFLQYLDQTGVRLDSYRSTGARAYLYDLSGPPKRSAKPDAHSPLLALGSRTRATR